MKKINRITALTTMLSLAVSCFSFTAASAESGDIYYDGTENVRGFSYPNYDDATMRNGGYDAGYDPTYDYTKDEQEVKWFIDEFFAFPVSGTAQGETINAISSWDVRNLGGSVKGQYYFYYELNDTSTEYDTSLSRQFENANHGKLNFEFLFTPIQEQDGDTFRLYQDNTVAVSFVLRKDGLYLQKPDGSEQFLHTVRIRGDQKIASQGWMSEAVHNTGVRAVINMDTNTIEKIYVNGEVVAENEPFMNNVSYINNCHISTGKENTGRLWMRALQLYRGWLLHDSFTYSQEFVPSEYNPQGNVTMKGVFKSQPFDWYNMVIDKGSSVNKGFEQVNGKAMAYEFHVRFPEKTDGFEMKLVGKGKDTFRVTTENGNFCYDTGNGSTVFYENYYKDCWYKIRAYLDLENKTMDLWLNGMKKIENIPLSNDSLDRLWVSVSSSAESQVEFDYPRLWFDTPEPEDYCPEPNPVRPSDPDLEVGMQVCPMYRSGYHSGWDQINKDKNRVPYYGYYDEGDPELADWVIKDLVEHGFTFQRVTIGAETPIQPCDQPFGFQWLDEGYKYAKYSDMMKYCVLWENASKYDLRPEYIIDTFATFCIEHYFKDDRYLRIDGRPVFVVYNLGSWKAHAAAQDDASIKALADGFRQRCIDAGVGNPIMCIGSGLNADGLANLPKYGFDVSTSYFADFTTDGIKQQLDYSAENASLGTGIVTLGAGINGLQQAYNFTPAEFGDVIDYYLETREKYPADSLARRMVAFETFDEFAEGHYLAPCGLYGFGYYDQVRAKFCGGDPSDHTDSVPTTAQKDRFNNCYPPNRRIENIHFRNGIGTTIPEDGKVILKYDFDDPDELTNWSSVDISNLRVEDGCLVGQVSGPDSQIYTPNLGIDSNGIVQIKMRIKFDTKKQYSERKIFYICDNGYGYRETQSSSNNKYLSSAEGFVDLIFPIAGTNLTGTLKQVRFDPINYNPADYTDTKFMIDSIEFIYSPSYDTTEADKEDFEKSPAFVQIEDEVTAIGAAPVSRDGKMYYPLRSVAYELGAKVDYDGKNNRIVVISNGMAGEIDLSEGKAYVNGGTVRATPVVINENDTTFISEKFFTQLFNKTLTYDESTRIINITDAVTGVEKKREIIKSFEFEKDGDTENWSVMQSVGAFTAKGGVATGSVSGTEPILVTSGLDFKAADVKNISVSFLNKTDVDKIKIYFLTDTDKKWSEGKKLEVAAKKSDDYKEYTIDPSTCAAWGGTITDLRFDPGNGASKGSFGIDYIRFEGDFAAASADTSCVTVTDNEYKWDFELNSPLDGWIFSRQLGDCVIENGLLSAYVIGPAPKLYSIGDLNLNADDIEEIEIKLNNATDGTAAKWQFLMNGEKDYEKALSVDFEIKPNDAEGSIYNIKTSDIEGFEGVLNGICLSPTNGMGAISIDYICLVTTEK